jgi:hypothetical protein
MTVLGVIADTHIPDRKRHLNPSILPIFRDAGVEAILHAGDISVPDVLQQLEQVAPVHAVRGNRDWVRLGYLPFGQLLSFNGISIALAHGHGHLQEYLVDKLHYALHGMQVKRYQDRLLQEYTQSTVIVYGHLHIPCNQWIDGQLLFNPGSACCPAKKFTPSVGLLQIHSGGQVQGEILELT